MELNPALHAVAVQPDAALHGLEGLKHLESSIVPGIYDPTVPDETLFISTEASYDAVRRFAEAEGQLIGPSAGAALAASLEIARREAAQAVSRPITIVMVFPDAGTRYVNEGLFIPLNGRPRSS